MKRILEASQKLSLSYACSHFAPSRFALLTFYFIIVNSPPSHPQNDVEEYLGGPDAAVERVLSAFQDALACVSPRFVHPVPHETSRLF